MVEKKDFTEYERELEDFEKKPLVPKKNEFNIFPPNDLTLTVPDKEGSKDQSLSTPKLSMRKKTQVDFEEAPEGVERIKPGSEKWKNIVQYFVQEYGEEEGVSEETIMISVSEYEVDEAVNFGDDIDSMVDNILRGLEEKGIDVYSSKLLVNSKILTLANKEAYIVKISGNLVYWKSENDFGSDFIENVKVCE